MPVFLPIFQELMDVALRTADPFFCLEPHLPKDRTGKVTVVGAGKASAKMAAAFEKLWEGPMEGLVITRYGHGFPTEHIEIVEAAHPVPDEKGLMAAKRIYEIASALGADDHLVVLMSGGGSALMSLPIDGVSFEQKQTLNKALLRSGANIHEMNCVRKHLSKIKGGGLAKAAYPARLSAFAISDVTGDDPSVIASGPTVADPTFIKDAQQILDKYDIPFEGEFGETAKAEDPCFQKSTYQLIATPKTALEEGARFLESKGHACHILNAEMEGDVREIAKVHLDYIENAPRPCFILSGGEATVQIKNTQGRGGPNAEFILHLLDLKKGDVNFEAMAIDTDGVDGSEDNAGAWIDPKTLRRVQEFGLSVSQSLEQNNSYPFFDKLGQLIKPGPTLTNINDFRVIYVR